MLVLRDPAAIAAITDPELRILLQQRLTALCQDGPDDPDVCGYFIVVEDGDMLGVLDKQLGFPVLTNRFDGKRYGEEGFKGCWEILEEHGNWYEFVFVLSDDGYGVLVFVPKTGEVDPALLAMCRQYAVKAPEDTE
jgi:hypothetical protein